MGEAERAVIEAHAELMARVDREIHALELRAAGGDLLARIELLRRVLSGVAANGTNCGACRMAADSARRAVERDDRVAVGEA